MGCEICGAETGLERRRARLAGVLTTNENEPAEAVIYCPDGAVREFDAPPGRPPKM